MRGEVWGRDEELTLASRALEGMASDPVAVVLFGEEGIGKSALWEEILHQASNGGCRVLSARPVESEAKFAFAALADLLRDAFDDVAPALPSPQRTALESALLRVDPVRGSPDARAVAFGFCGCLRAMATEQSQPLVVGVDDVQWLDAPSARVLEFALRRLQGEPIGAVLAVRPDPSEPSHPSPLGLDRGPLQQRIHRILVGPLELEVLRQLLRSRLDIRLPQWALAQIHESSGGNPLLALELARALVRGGVEPEPGQPLPVPKRLAELVGDRLDVLSERVRRMLLLVSSSGQPTVASISRALGDPTEFDADVATALEADVIEVSSGRIQFTTPLLGTVLYSGSTPGERRHAHRMLADIASDPEEQARHLALAAAGADEAVAQILEEAAQRARSRGAPEAAAELAELARGLTPTQNLAARTRRTAHAGRYAFESAQTERAEELLQEAAAASAPGPLRAEALLYLSRVHYHRRDSRSASALAEEALREARVDPSLQASIYLELAAGSELSGDHRTATTRARRALRLAERSGDRTILAESLSVVALYEFLSGQGLPRHMIQRARSLQEAGLPIRPLRSPAFYEACMLMWSDELTEARAGLRQLERRSREAADESSLSILLFLLSQIESWAGNLPEASRLADESRAVAEWTGQRGYLAFAMYAQGLAESVRGEVERALRLGEESLDLARQTGSAQAIELAHTVLGFLELSRGDARRAHDWLSELVEVLGERGPADPGTLRFLPDEMEALIELDEVGRAEALLAPFEARARRLGRAWALGAANRCRGLALASRRELSSALDAFDRAEEQQRGLGQPLELGRTHLSRGRVLRRNKKWSQARDSLHEALRVFDEVGASLWANRARSELARVGGRTADPTRLTETEGRVVELVAAGLSNREAAARLFLSVSTVESNLRRAYRKLGVTSRSQLSHKLSSSGAPRAT
jgi:DNA-binding CsgD family transcriptional regulator